MSLREIVIDSLGKVKAKDVLYGEYLEAKALINTTEEGTTGGMYPIGSKERLSMVLNNALESISANDEEAMAGMSKTIKTAKDEYISKRIPDKSELTTLIYDDFENDVVGERPAGLFFRSYEPLNVKVSKDITNPLNKVFECRDEEPTYQYGNRSNGTLNACPAKIVFAKDMYIYAGNKKEKLMTYSPNTWYDVHMKLNLKEKYYDIYINGELVKEKAALNSNSKSVNQFVFDSADGTSESKADRGGFYLDNIILFFINIINIKCFIKH